MQLNDYIYWIDANLPPKTVNWLVDEFGVVARHAYSMGFLTTEDHEIFTKAKESSIPVIIVTKDEDFIKWVLQRKSPPKIIWITLGNLSNRALKEVLLNNFKAAVTKLFSPQEHFIEIG